MAWYDWIKDLFTGPAPRQPTSGPPAAQSLGGPRPAPSATPRPAFPTAAPSSPPVSRGSTTLEGLDLGPFAPLTGKEIEQQAGDVGSLWGNPWFGRRDLIPPSSDRRTQLIDRGMVGQGMITPEELEEIHRVGTEMDRLRPDLALAAEMAAQTIARSEADKARIKAEKKAQAAERKRLHAEAVVRRRQTDIIFLGRGVSRGLADRRANVERLQAQGLPVLSSPADVAAAIGISIPQLRWLAFHNEAAARIHYVSFTVTKRSGGVRRLSSPHRQLRQCQEWILANVLGKLSMHEAAHGFVTSRSTVTNATAHVGKDIVVNCDLEDFFPTISFSRAKGVFRWLGYSPAVATILALLCTEAPRRIVQYAGQKYHVATGPRALPQGACTSPALSNLVCRRLDKRFAGLCAKLGWTYTRYADDLTFSADGPTARNIGYLLARVRHIAADEGFRVNEKKTRVQRQSTQQSVTGVVVNERLGAPRKLVRRLRAILHRARREGLKPQNREQRPNFEAWLEGMIAYIAMLNPEQGIKLRGEYESLQPR